MYSGCTLGQSELTTPTVSVDLANWNTDLTHEFNVSIEHELFQDFGLSLSFNYKRMGRYSWTLDYYPGTDHVLSKNDYVVAGTVPGTPEQRGRPDLPDGRGRQQALVCQQSALYRLLPAP